MRSFYFIFLISFAGCATYSEKISDSYTNIQSGDMDAAVGEINKALQVESSKHLPSKTDENTHLLLLERATILQGMGEYELSARDFVYADQHLGWFDPRKMTSLELGDYLYSGNATEYRAPASERLLINVQNMINFLVLNNLSAAKVEARRFAILTEYFQKNEEAFRPDVLAVGNYLGGVTFEKSAEFKDAALMYGRAWHYGYREKELEERLIDLFRITGNVNYKIDPKLSGLDTFLARSKALEPMSSQDYLAMHKDDLLVLVQTGKVARRGEKEINLDKENEKATAAKFGQNFNSINVPEMTGSHSGSAVELHLGHQNTKLTYKSEVALEFQRSFDSIQPAIYSAAMSRALSRHLVGEGASSVGGDNAVSSLIGLGLKGALNTNDRPDTRSWSTSPAKISFVRKTYVAKTFRFATLSNKRSHESKVVEGDFPVINFSKLR